MMCTVCREPYDVRVKAQRPNAQEVYGFCCRCSDNCGIARGHVRSSLRQYIGLLCIVIGTSFWVFSTAIYVVGLPTPERTKNWNYFLIVVTVLDIVICISTLWFTSQLRWGSTLYFQAVYV